MYHTGSVKHTLYPVPAEVACEDAGAEQIVFMCTSTNSYYVPTERNGGISSLSKSGQRLESSITFFMYPRLVKAATT
jgi:hypothetical protein